MTYVEAFVKMQAGFLCTTKEHPEIIYRTNGPYVECSLNNGKSWLECGRLPTKETYEVTYVCNK